MLMRTDPFREIDRLTQQVFGSSARPVAMLLDAWKEDDSFIIEFDLPGVQPDSIDLDIERNVLTVRAERKPRTGDDTEVIAAERSYGVFSRQLILGDSLDAEKVQADYNAGVLSVRIPVLEETRPRRIEITNGGQKQEINA